MEAPQSLKKRYTISKNESPLKRTTTLAGASPSKTEKMGSTAKKEKPKAEAGGEEKKESGLSSPTSVSMQNSFIIKNADETFDAYYQSMRKRKFQAGATMGDSLAASGSPAATSNFGVVSGVEPAARDGHTTDINDDGLLFVFGGDRHHMPFNDLYLMRL